MAFKPNKIEQCVVCGQSFTCKRKDARCCSAKCRKRLSRHTPAGFKKGEPIIRIGNVTYPAHVVNMFSDEEITKMTGIKFNSKKQKSNESVGTQP